jgi:3-oxoacyl-(acyl-carrier-protein) synthase/acyl carrier protein
VARFCIEFRTMNQRLSNDDRAVAIIGLSVRFPGAPCKEVFWKNQVAARSGLSEIPADRWNWREIFGDPVRENGKTNSKWGGFLSDLDKFDPLYFGISPSEAELMDPQHRLFIKATWEAFWDAGYRPSDFAGCRVGVFAGVQFQEYQQLLLNAGVISARVCTGNAQTMLPNRVSYLLDVGGPSESIDTSCSSSLVALHHALAAIRTGACDMAIAGGANLILVPDVHVMGSQMGVLSPTGRSKPLDVDADGYVRSEGIGVLLLKRLPDAIRDNDNIYAIVRGSAVNHGGRSNSLTAPRSRAQSEVMIAAINDASIDPTSISYVEMHCTGTVVGDPIEFEAVKMAFERLGAAADDFTERSCALASVKANIGHLEAASGIAGVVNTVLAMQHRWLPGMSSFTRLNPKIDLTNTPFFINAEGETWFPSKKGARCALVNSFGFGGTNSSVVIEEYQPDPEPAAQQGTNEQVFIPLSAFTAAQLADYCKSLRASIERLLETSKYGKTASLFDIARTLQHGREGLSSRVIMKVQDLSELFAGLRAVSDGKPSRYLIRTPQEASSQNVPPPVLQWLNGQTDKWPDLPQGRRVSLAFPPWNDGRYWYTGQRQDTGHGEARDPGAEFAYLRPVWRERKLEGERRIPDHATSILIFGEDPEEVKTFQSRLQDCGANTGSAIACFAYSHASADQSKDAGGVRERILDEWLESSARTNGAPDVIFLIGGSQAGTSVDQDIAGCNAETVFRVTRALMTRWHRRDIEIFYVAANPPDICPAEGALEAFAKSVQLENSRYRFHVIYPDDVSLIRRVETAITEFVRAGAAKSQVAKYEAGIRYTRGLESSTTLREVSDEHRLRLKQGGVYFLPGGAGELGSRIAVELAKSHRANIVLLGRSSSESLDARLKQIEATGGEASGTVVYRQCDIANLEDVRSAVDYTVQRFGGVDGVMCLATAHKDALIFNKSWEDFNAVAASKVAGTRNVDLATSELELDFFVVFSSQAALGMGGASDYAYGCEFQNQYIVSRNRLVTARRRSGRSLAVNWSRWMWDKYVTEGFDQWVASLGYKFLDVETGLSALTKILASGEERVFVLHGDRARILSNIDLESGLLESEANEKRWQGQAKDKEDRKVEQFLDRLSESELISLASRLGLRESAAVDGVQPGMNGNTARIPVSVDRLEIKSSLLAVLIQQLKIDDIGDETDFPSLGVDSITAINVVAELENQFGIEIHPNWLFLYPNLTLLSQQLRDEISAQKAATGAAAS